MGAKIIVPVGYVSWELSFIEELPNYKCRCLCSCGKEVILAKCNFTSGHTKSCGHLNKMNPPATKYGATKDGKIIDGTYMSYRKMLERIRYPKHNPHYIGISICDRWEPRQGGSFIAFVADMGERPDGMSLDRIDPYGNYEPSNCKWSTPLEQAANRRAWKHTPEGLARINAKRRT